MLCVNFLFLVPRFLRLAFVDSRFCMWCENENEKVRIIALRILGYQMKGKWIELWPHIHIFARFSWNMPFKEKMPRYFVMFIDFIQQFFFFSSHLRCAPAHAYKFDSIRLENVNIRNDARRTAKQSKYLCLLTFAICNFLMKLNLIRHLNWKCVALVERYTCFSFRIL